jgi:hypothetical protein
MPGDGALDPEWLHDVQGSLTGHVSVVPEETREDWVEVRAFGRGCSGGWTAGPYTEAADLDVTSLALDGTCAGLVAIQVLVDVHEAQTGALVNGHQSAPVYALVTGSTVTRWLDLAEAKAAAILPSSDGVGDVQDDSDLVGREVTGVIAALWLSEGALANTLGTMCFDENLNYTDGSVGDYLTGSTTDANGIRVKITDLAPLGLTYWFWADSSGCINYNLPTNDHYDVDVYMSAQVGTNTVYVHDSSGNAVHTNILSNTLPVNFSASHAFGGGGATYTPIVAALAFALSRVDGNLTNGSTSCGSRARGTGIAARTSRTGGGRSGPASRRPAISASRWPWATWTAMATPTWRWAPSISLSTAARPACHGRARRM